jgi:Fe-S cluster assembly protein SufD
MTEALTKTGFDEEALAALPPASPFVEGLRKRGLDDFRALPIPSQETEEWRYTDLSAFELDFAPFAAGVPAGNLDDVPEEVLSRIGHMGDRSGLQIQHDSTVTLSHLEPDLSARGVVLTSLDRALEEHAALVEDRLHELVPPDRTKFTALHAAFRTGGTFVYVPRDVRVELPLQTVTYVGTEGLAVFPHTVIVLDQGAELTFIDRYVSPPLPRAFSDAVVELFLGPNSRLSYVSMQDWGAGMTHLSVQRALVGRDAQLRTLGVAFGGSLSRAEVESELEGDGGSSEMLGVYFGDGDQHIDHRSIQDHVGNRTSSDLLFKGALKDRSEAIYIGTVIIEKGAHLCNAYQTNRNILLSETAKAHSVPNLEILTNDPTRCGHAASVGPVDDDQLFYLQSRGIPRDEAVRLIVTGFFREVLDRVDLEEIRTTLEQAIEAELEGM